MSVCERPDYRTAQCLQACSSWGTGSTYAVNEGITLSEIKKALGHLGRIRQFLGAAFLKMRPQPDDSNRHRCSIWIGISVRKEWLGVAVFSHPVTRNLNSVLVKRRTRVITFLKCSQLAQPDMATLLEFVRMGHSGSGEGMTLIFRECGCDTHPGRAAIDSSCPDLFMTIPDAFLLC